MTRQRFGDRNPIEILLVDRRVDTIDERLAGFQARIEFYFELPKLASLAACGTLDGFQPGAQQVELLLENVGDSFGEPVDDLNRVFG